MMDIVEELNLMVPQMPMVGERRDAYAPWRAADEITRLRAEVERLREALEQIADRNYVSADINPNAMYRRWRRLATGSIDIARAALQEKPDG